MSPRNARRGLWLGKFSKNVVKISKNSPQKLGKKNRKELGFKKAPKVLGLVWAVGAKKLSEKKEKKLQIKEEQSLNTLSSSMPFSIFDLR